MDQPHLVGAIQCRGNLFDHRDRALGAEPSTVFCDVLQQIAALDQPHVDIQSTIDLAVTVDGHHMWVVEACRYACLSTESLLKLLVPRQVRGEHLQRDYPVGGGVVGTVDLSHAAAPQDFQQLVLPE